MAKTKKTVTRQTAKSRKGTSTTKKAATKKPAAQDAAMENAVAVNRRSSRDRRTTPDRRKGDVPVAVERRKIERRAKVNRRRQIDPTTCERDYTGDEIEFMNALDEYKRSSGRMFPTCSEILEVIRKLGYGKPEAADRTEQAASQATAAPEPPAPARVEPLEPEAVAI